MAIHCLYPFAELPYLFLSNTSQDIRHEVRNLAAFGDRVQRHA
jgi:hypothetical protein